MTKEEQWLQEQILAAKSKYTRRLHIGDNLDFLKSLERDSIDLIATDPPFNKKQTFTATEGSISEGAQFNDSWQKKDVIKEWNMIQLYKPVVNLVKLISEIEGKPKNSLAAFVCWMAPRILEMKRVLKPTGSLYLHCDSSANSYLRMLLDAVFGRDNFRNEIVWCYYSGGPYKNRFKQKHDTILWYAVNSTGYTFNRQYTPLTEEDKKTYNKVDEDGRHYQVYRGARVYMDEVEGKPILSWWVGIPSFGNASRSKERAGWPTQKPVALYERIIKASSNLGDIVLDPFCGSGTTLVAADNLNRQWIGCDISDKAESVIASRINSAVKVTRA